MQCKTTVGSIEVTTQVQAVDYHYYFAMYRLNKQIFVPISNLLLIQLLTSGL